MRVVLFSAIISLWGWLAWFLFCLSLFLFFLCVCVCVFILFYFILFYFILLLFIFSPFFLLRSCFLVLFSICWFPVQ